MSHAKFFHAALGLLLVSLSSPAATGPAGELREGDYLSRTCIAALKKTLSPRAALKTHVPQALQVKKTELMAVQGFHEGYPLFDIEKGVVSKKPRGSSSPDYVIKVNKNEIEFGESSLATETFVFVRDAESYIANIVLAGTYADADGKRVVFGKDGILKLPARTLKYHIGVDFVGSDSDYYTTEAPYALFEFVRTAKGLLIYEREELVPREHDAKPLYILTHLP